MARTRRRKRFPPSERMGDGAPADGASPARLSMDPDLVIPLVPAVAALVAVNAFFAAAESALPAVRPLRAEIRPYPHENGTAEHAPHRTDELVLAAQLGRSASSLLLGFLLADAALRMAGPGAPSGGGIAVALAVTAVLHAVVGEHVPRALAARRPGWVPRAVRAPLRLFALLVRPLAWPLARIAGGVVRWVGGSAHPSAATPEEIRLMVDPGSGERAVEEDEREMIRGVFEISRTVAREVMTPRTEMVAVPVDVTLDGLVEVVVEEGHSRIPVYEGSIDNVVGVVLTKDLFPLLWKRDAHAREAFDVRALMREACFVPDTKPVDDLLAELRHQSVHLAIVVDEFGGTYGLVTLEDLLEEIVGEINDEYDVAEPEFEATPEGDVLIDGAASIYEVNERFGTSLPEEDFDTLGGFIFGALERVPQVGDSVAVPSSSLGEVLLRVEETEERRVALVRLTRHVPADAPA